VLIQSELAPKESTANLTDFMGTWKLNSFDTRLSSGQVRHPLGPEPIGRITYDDEGNTVTAVMVWQRL
jgi:hypothetical protein